MVDRESWTEGLLDQGKDIFGKSKAIAVDKTKDGPTEMFVVVFEGEAKAREVLETLGQLEDDRLVKLGKAAVITRDGAGEVVVDETADMSTKESAVAGAAAGALLGLVTGRGLLGGALLGAGGGAVAAKGLDLGLDDAYLQEVGESLQPRSSALVATIDFQSVQPAMEALDQFDGGTILTQTLAPEVAAQLSAAIED
jgi:uncharacterized membrane protein